MDQLQRTPESRLLNQTAALDTTAAPAASSTRQRSASARQSSQQLSAAPVDSMEDKFATLTAVAGQLFQQRSNNLTQLDALKQETDQSTAVVEQLHKTHSLLANCKAQHEADIEELLQVTKSKQTQLTQAERAVLRTAQVQERVTRETMTTTQRVTDAIKTVVDRNVDATTVIEDASRLVDSQLESRAACAKEVSDDIATLLEELTSTINVHTVCATTTLRTQCNAETADGISVASEGTFPTPAILSRFKTIVHKALCPSAGATPNEGEESFISNFLHDADPESWDTIVNVPTATALVERYLADKEGVLAHFAALARFAEEDIHDVKASTLLASFFTAGATAMEAALEKCLSSHQLAQHVETDIELKVREMEEELAAFGALELKLNEMLDSEEKAGADIEVITVAADEEDRIQEGLAKELEELISVDQTHQEAIARSVEGHGAVVSLEEHISKIGAEITTLQTAIAKTQASTEAIKDEITSIINPQLEAATLALNETRDLYPPLSEFDAELKKCSHTLLHDTVSSIPSVITHISVLVTEGGDMYGKTAKELEAYVLDTMCPALPLPPSGCGRWEADESDNLASVSDIPSEMKESADYPPPTPTNPSGGGVAAEQFLQQLAFTIANESHFFENGVKLHMMNASHSLQQEAAIYSERAKEELSTQARHLATYLKSLPADKRPAAQRMLAPSE